MFFPINICSEENLDKFTQEFLIAQKLSIYTKTELTLATLLLTEDSIKKFLREFYTKTFRGVTLATYIMLLPLGSFRYRVFERALLF